MSFGVHGGWDYTTFTVTIGAAGTVSSAADLGMNTLIKVTTPAVLSNATMYFNVSDDNVTFYPLYDNTNTLVSLTVGTALAGSYPVNPAQFAGSRYVQAKMSGAEGSARSIIFTARPV